MKPLIVVYSLLMMLFCCSCGSGHPDRRVTEENAYEGVSNYCHQMYEWSIAQENPSIMYVERGWNRILRMKWYFAAIRGQRFIFMLTSILVLQRWWRKYRYLILKTRQAESIYLIA